MTTDMEHTENEAHELIGRLFTAAEPPHRDLAEASITHGAAALRRQRGLLAGGAMLSVVAGTAAAVSLGGHSTAPGGGKDVAVTASGAEAPTPADKQREIDAELPRLLTPLLPNGMTLAMEKAALPAFVLQSADAGTRQTVEFGIGLDSAVGPADGGRATQVAVPGGQVKVEEGLSDPRVIPTGPGKFQGTRYTFVPDDTHQTVAKVFLLHSGTPLLTPQDFANLVVAPSFAPVRSLLDPAVPASAKFVALRGQAERRIAARVRDVLPSGYTLQLSPNQPGEYDLVGPQGVMAFAWYAAKLHEKDFTQEAKCPEELRYTEVCSLTDVSGGKLMYQNGALKDVSGIGEVRLGVYMYQSADPDGPTVTLKIFRDTGNSATPGPGLSVAQVLKIAQSPDIVEVVAQVDALANVDAP
jgi:hypothetical protein